VHQGNGTAAIFREDPEVFTFSMHGAKNYPFEKPPSTLDVSLPDATTDAAYLETLRQHLPDVLDQAAPDLVFYLAGIDVMADDRYGRMALSRDGLHARDRYVLETIRARAHPVALLLSGGYAATPELTADLHAVAFREAHRVYA
jgi:acetoin utilization deacetylase AcuC-like enzyme